jgi:predicted MPP superfamily phosphohydrolase
LALVHEPDYFPTMVKSTPVQLQLSGYSHGGHVRIPPLAADLAALGSDLPYWPHELNGRFVDTGRGLGMVELPLRFNCPPELAGIMLRAA